MMRPILNVPATLSVDSLLQISLFFYLIALTGYWVVGDGPYFDFQTFIIAFLFGSLLLFFVVTARGNNRVLMSITALYLSIYCLFRLLSYLYLPDLVTIPIGSLDPNLVNQGLSVVVLGLLALLIGMRLPLGDISYKLTSSPVALDDLRVQALFGYFLLVSVLELYLIMEIGAEHMKTADQRVAGIGYQLLRATLSVDVGIFFLIFEAVKSRGKRGKLFYIGVAGAIIVYIGLMVLGGSRSGFLRVVLIALTSFLLIDYRLRLKYVLISLVLVTASGVLVFMFATNYRTQLVNSGGGFKTERLGLAASVGERSVSIMKSIEVLIDRFGVLDFALVVTTQDGYLEQKKKFSDPVYIAKSIINAVPGTPFPEAAVNTSRAISIIYGDVTESYVKKSAYHSQFWTVWGVVMSVFPGYLYYFVLFVLGVLLRLGYLMTLRIEVLEKLGVHCFYLYLMPPLFIFTMGIDHTVITLVVHVVQIMTLLVFVYLFLIMARFSSILRYRIIG